VTGGRDVSCQVCGHDVFVHADVLWPRLVEDWELSEDEVRYVNVQQGTRCERCNANVRSQALARALLQVVGWNGALDAYVATNRGARPRVLEVNEAGSLTPWLSRLEAHQLARYPDCDLMHLPFADAAFDVVVHSDTLEHVREPLVALGECRRVLGTGGACVFTVPVTIARLTRSRAKLSDSYHGHPDCRDAGYLVHTEFGSDVWTEVLQAGFDSCEMVPFRYPAGLALIGRRR
jgi:SAM-dependent methyltransferase